MLTLIFGFLAFVVVAIVTRFAWPWSLPNLWAGLFGFFAFLAVAIPLNFRTKNRITAVFNKMQQVLTDGQNTLRRQVEQMQRSFSGSPKAMQGLLEKKQADLLRSALLVLDEVKPLQRWSVLVERQANTVRAQLYFQLKEFEACDRHMKKAFFFDPQSMALKLVRMSARGEKESFEKAAKKAILRFKGEKGVLLYALYAWVLVKEGRVQEAMELLAKGKDSTHNEILRQNWEHLANGRVKSFSNAGFGEIWYSLQLEQPKIQRQRQHQHQARFR